jgi:cellulose synthase/poly-beta-1,6-N-acetylglucosamine synthase-like glycosyltransferase
MREEGNMITWIMLGAYYFMLYCSVFWLLVYMKNRDTLFKDPVPKKYSGVSILIPAFNEEEHIEKCLKYCFAAKYPKKEIIVINDGSTDATADICRKYEKEGKIRLINKKENTGKGASLNVGFKQAKYPFIMGLDADSFLNPNAIKAQVGYFDDESVGAVTSSMKVYSDKKILQKIQSIEYYFAIFLRKLMTSLNCLYVIPGPGSMYRKKVLEELGGFDEYNLTEDLEIAFRIQKKGYKIANSLNATVLTMAPDNVKKLFTQRRRWYVGYLKNQKRYSEFLFNKKYGDLGVFLLPSNFVWLSLMTVIFGTIFYSNIQSFVLNLLKVLSIDFDIPVILTSGFNPLGSIAPNTIMIFAIIFTSMSIIAIYLSVKLSKEKIDLEKKFLSYTTFLIVYPFMMVFFWISAIFFTLIGFKSRFQR